MTCEYPLCLSRATIAIRFEQLRGTITTYAAMRSYCRPHAVHILHWRGTGSTSTAKVHIGQWWDLESLSGASDLASLTKNS